MVSTYSLYNGLRAILADVDIAELFPKVPSIFTRAKRFLSHGLICPHASISQKLQIGECLWWNSDV